MLTSNDNRRGGDTREDTMAETENHTLALLREIRGAIAGLERKIDTDIASVRADIEDLRTRIDGHTVILNMVAGNHETRIQRLEDICPTDA